MSQHLDANNDNNKDAKSFHQLIREQSNDSEEKSEKLLQAALTTISNSYQEGINNITKQLQKEQKTNDIGLNNINQEILALSHQKKELQNEMSQFNKKGNQKINELFKYQIFFDKLLIKYKQAINNKFLVTHQNINNQVISSKQWKHYLIELIKQYPMRLQDYQNQVLHEMLKSKEPLLPPSNPVNPSKIYGTPHDVHSHNHNLNVLKNYHKSTSTYPSIMSPEDITYRYSKIGEKCDYRDYEGRYLPVVIKAIGFDDNRKSRKLGITYEGWGKEYDVWSVVKVHYQRFAEHESISKRESINRKCMRNIKCGQLLEIKPIHLYNDRKSKNIDNAEQYLQWYPAKVLNKDANSAQIKCILYKYCQQNNKWSLPEYKYCNQSKKMRWLGDIYWVHLDNNKECQPMNTYFKDVNYLT